MIKKISRIKINRIKCKKCGDIIESNDAHDFKWCSCGTVAIYGGREYLRRLGNYEDYVELSQYIQLAKIITDGFEVVENALSKEDLSPSDIRCHICGSNYISIQKGDGESIMGDDRVSLVCHYCKKIYKFNDVKNTELKHE